MTRKEIRATKTRLHGTILPSHARFMQTAVYEDFHLYRTDGSNTTYKEISPSATFDLKTVSNIALTPLTLWDWKPLANTSTTLTAPSIVNNTAVNVGRGYVTYLKQEVPKSELNSFSIKMTVSFTGQYQRVYCGFLNGTDTLTVTGLNIMLGTYITEGRNHDTHHTLEIKFLDKIGYVYINNQYTGLSYNYSSVTKPVYVCFYTAIQVYDITFSTVAGISTAPGGT